MRSDMIIVSDEERREDHIIIEGNLFFQCIIIIDYLMLHVMKDC